MIIVESGQREGLQVGKSNEGSSKPRYQFLETDMLYEEKASMDHTGNTLLQLSQDRKLCRNMLVSKEINVSNVYNLTLYVEDAMNCSCEKSLPPLCNTSLHENSPLPEKNWPALLVIVVMIVTIAGNILVIMAVSLEKRLQNATNYFLMSLAIADMLLGFLVMPVSMLTILYGEYNSSCTLGKQMLRGRIPKVGEAGPTEAEGKAGPRALQSCSIPGKNARGSNLKQLQGISMPVPVFGLHDHSKVFRNGSCLLADENFVLIGSFVAFFIPLVIMVITYFLTIKSLQKEAMLCMNDLHSRPKFASFSFFPQSSLISNKFFQRSLSKESGISGRRTMQSISNEQKASKVLGIVFFLFVVMWCPFFITNVMTVICKEACNKEVIERLLNVFVWIGYLSSAVNPLVYTLFNKTYRTAFSRYIRCQYREEKKPLQMFLANTIPAIACHSGHLKKESELLAKDISIVNHGRCNLDGTLKSNASQENEKVSCL
nr:5-hydroxytryptamine receptor 2A [Anolis sagrei ordinatus]